MRACSTSTAHYPPYATHYSSLLITHESLSLIIPVIPHNSEHTDVLNSQFSTLASKLGTRYPVLNTKCSTFGSANADAGFLGTAACWPRP